MMLFPKPEKFWSEIGRLDGSVTPYVAGRVLLFGLLATIITYIEIETNSTIAVEVTPYEILGAALGALLVLRTNAGLDRWWEARKRWGGIVNQCRNLAVECLAYGPEDPEWRRAMVVWTAAFAHCSRASLRGQSAVPELEPLLGPTQARRIQSAEHFPSAVALALGTLLREGLERGMGQLAFARAEEQRAILIDHVGSCERILKTPIPLAYSIQIRQFIFLFLVSLPFGIVSKLEWLTPLATMLVAYPILALDEIGVELQNPFSLARLNHLPLDDICATIESNLMFLLIGWGETRSGDFSRESISHVVLGGNGEPSSPAIGNTVHDTTSAVRPSPERIE